MAYPIVFVVSIISAYLFDLMPVAKNTGLIFELQRLSFCVIRDQKLTDEQKQKILLTNAAKLLLVTLKLLFFFCIVTLPFYVLVELSTFFLAMNIESTLISVTGISLSAFAFVSYFLLKKIYGRFRI